MKKIIKLTESELVGLVKKIIIEQDIKVQKAGNNISINGVNYKLQIYKLGGWKNVSVDALSPRTDGGYDIEASLGFISKKDIVPADTISVIKNNLKKSEIELGGKTPKKLVKL
jgi:hypothetical protein